jgi:hypothetical protein
MVQKSARKSDHSRGSAALQQLSVPKENQYDLCTVWLIGFRDAVINRLCKHKSLYERKGAEVGGMIWG